MHNWVLHRSGVNKTDKPRRALSVSFMDAKSKVDNSVFDKNLGKNNNDGGGFPEGSNVYPVIF